MGKMYQTDNIVVTTCSDGHDNDATNNSQKQTRRQGEEWEGREGKEKMGKIEGKGIREETRLHFSIFTYTA